MKRYAVILAAAAALGGCEAGRHVQGGEPTQRLEGLELRQSTLGSPTWDLKSRSAKLTDGDKRADLVAPHVKFYKEGKQVSQVTAMAGFVLTDTHDVTLSSSVVVKSLEDQTILNTEELRYSSEKKKFVTDRYVVVNRPGGTLRGRGLEASPDLSEIRIFKQETVIEERP